MKIKTAGQAFCLSALKTLLIGLSRLGPTGFQCVKREDPMRT